MYDVFTCNDCERPFVTIVGISIPPPPNLYSDSKCRHVVSLSFESYANVPTYLWSVQHSGGPLSMEVTFNIPQAP